MIVTLNLKSNKDFILYCFGTNFFTKVVKEINTISEKKKLLNILNNLFLHEFTEIFFRNEIDENLENLYIIENTEFSKNSLDIDARYSPTEYKNIFKYLSTFSISYDNFFNNVNIEDDERSYYKLLISQSIIRLTFSKEKRKYVENIKNFEFELLKTLVEKNMKETFKKCNEKYKVQLEQLKNKFIEELKQRETLNKKNIEQIEKDLIDCAQNMIRSKVEEYNNNVKNDLNSKIEQSKLNLNKGIEEIKSVLNDINTNKDEIKKQIGESNTNFSQIFEMSKINDNK